MRPVAGERAPFELPDVTENALLEALCLENQRLRERTHSLERQLAATQAAQSEMARVLRITAPLRRLQEMARLRRQERRRALSQGTEPTRQSATSTASLPPFPTISDREATRYPLLARTRDWAAGQAIPRPDTLPIRTGMEGRVLVIAHVFYPEIWPDLAKHIQRIPAPLDLVVTLVDNHSDLLLDQIVAQFPQVVIETLPNRGRDMLPFVRVAQMGLMGNYDAVLKIHTKRSVHRLDGTAWRRRLLDALCPSPEGIGLILDLLRTDPHVGMVAPAGSLLGREFWGGNSKLVEALALRTGVALDPERVWFPGGSMFWSRPTPLNRLRDTDLTPEDFEPETAVLDSSTAHALERFIGVLIAASGYSVIDTDEVAGRLVDVRTTRVGTRDPRGRAHVAAVRRAAL